MDSALEDGPAARAGVKTSDRITRINGLPMQGVPLVDALARLAGPAGEKVTLTVLRTIDERVEELEVDVLRVRPSDLVSSGAAQRRSSSSYTPTKFGGPVQWRGNRIVSRVLPYPDLVSLFIRLPVAHAAATGRGVHVGVVRRGEGRSIGGLLRDIAPDALVHEYAVDSEHSDLQALTKRLQDDGCRVVLIPDADAWPAEAILHLAEDVLADQRVLVVPADFSEDPAQIGTIHALHARGALTVGRVDRQSLVLERVDDRMRAFNQRIREIQVDVFSTVGIAPHVDAALPAVAAAGVAALVLEKWPGLSGAEVRAQIVDGARRVWQATSVETGQWTTDLVVDPITTEYRPSDETSIFRFRALDAAGALDVDTEIPWFLNMLNCHKAWEITKGRGAVIVVSDQGFHIGHPDLAGRIQATARFGPSAFEDAGQNFHGTDMSRILLAVAPEAKIVPVLCSARDMADLPTSIAKSFELALARKADVITASWSGRFSDSEELLSAVRKAADGGVAVSWFHFPGTYPGVLRPSFSYDSWRSEPGLAFADRFLTDPPGFHPVEIEAGLSGTAPQAAGLAALVRSVNPDLTAPEIEKLIFDHSDPIGSNLLIPDAYRIVQAALTTS